ncbi:MAG: hypothetical protein Q9192_006287 [Flavoplaca navasiana]
MARSSWPIAQIAQILPLDEESLQEILDYTSTLSKDDSADHLRNLLGTSPKALDFINSFNARRETPAAPSRSATPEASEASKKTRKKKQPLNKPFNPRQPEDYGNTGGGYQKRTDGDYMTGKQRKEPALANTLALSDKPDARQLPVPLSASSTSSPKKPPSAIGPLISDLPNVRSGSRTNSRTSSPAPKTKVNVAGGAAMHGASSTLQDLVRFYFSATLPSAPSKSKPIPPSPTNPPPHGPAPATQPVIPSSLPPPTVRTVARSSASKKGSDHAHSARNPSSHPPRSTP